MPPAACGKPVCSERAARIVKETLHKARLTALYTSFMQCFLKTTFNMDTDTCVHIVLSEHVSIQHVPDNKRSLILWNTKSHHIPKPMSMP